MPGSSLTYRILGDPSSAIRAMHRTRDEVDKSTKGIRESFKKLAAISAGVSLAGFAKDAIDEARESQKVNAQTGAVLKSTGQAAGVSAGHVGDLANAVSKYAGIDDEAIQAGENLLLTFTQIRNGVGKGNDVFDQATKAATDMAVAMGTDVKSAAMQLGKALNDPLKGMTKLQKVGVTFTQQQKDQITQMVKAGNVAGAQKLILQELQREFGGSAAAQATAADKAEVAWKNFEEQVGTAFIPALDTIATTLSDDVVPALSSTFSWLDKHKTEVKIVGGAVLGLWGAWKGYTIVRAASAWFTTAAAKYRQYVAELSYGNRAQRAASSGMRGMAAAGKVLGPLAIGLTAAGYGVSKLADDAHHASGVFIGYEKIVKGFKDELIASNGAINDQVRLSVGLQLQQHGLASRAKAAGISLRDLETAVLGNDDAMGRLLQRWSQSGKPSQETVGAVLELHKEFGTAAGSAKELTGSLDSAQKASTKHKTAEQQEKDATAALNKEIRQQKAAMDKLVSSILAASSNKVAAAQAELQFRDGLAQAKQQVKDNGKALDGYTAKGRANREWLLDQIDSINQVASAQQAAKRPAAEVAAKWAENVRQLKETATAAGLSRTQVDNLVSDMTRSTRRKFRFQLDADLSSAKQKLRDLKAYWEGLRITLHAALTTGTKGSDPRLGGGYASGTGSASPGPHWVGEHGKELLWFKGGEQVLSHPNSMRLASAGGYAAGTTTLAQMAAAGGGTLRVVLDVPGVGVLTGYIDDRASAAVQGHASHRATLDRMNRNRP